MSLILEGGLRTDDTRPQLFLGGVAAAANAEVLDENGVVLLVAAVPHAQKGAVLKNPSGAPFMGLA